MCGNAGLAIIDHRPMVKMFPTASVYQDALLGYLEGSGEFGLEQAYGFGRSCLHENGSLLRLIHVHDRALQAIIASTAAPAEVHRRVNASMEFLVEVLAPFEMAFCCYRSFLADSAQHRV
jgi:hypothetical protein